MKHKIDYCNLCQHLIIRCGTCNNNCCNAMYGKVNGKDCIDCPSAYDEQENNHFLNAHVAIAVKYINEKCRKRQ